MFLQMAFHTNKGRYLELIYYGTVYLGNWHCDILPVLMCLGGEMSWFYLLYVIIK